MRIIAVLVLVFGVALSGGALFFASEYFKGINALNAQGPETVRVLVAKQALAYGATIQPGNLQWVEWPKNVVPPGSFTSAEDLLGKDGNQKRVVLRAIDPGEPILDSKITKFGESNRMALNLAKGKRAVSISINAVSGVAGFVAAGDRVDILLTRTQQGQLTSSVILQGITVIATDQRVNTQTTSARVARTVTVEVDTTQAQTLAVAQQMGSLSLILRGIEEDLEGDNVTPVTAGMLSDFETPEEEASRQVRVRRAGRVVDEEIDEEAQSEGEAPAEN